ncbi:uncharacterized protein LOC122562193 [Chiloscyllium plagiosum]|uniref:uncharacterized protein LOC122562193 n=1 Tax=Chiloscyllium plagiosum TaxID=36176 RepID=UPI001CB869BC|nr:uncharacterized protein LOC122562193 [Chiloscyllium plagiosum]XP_043570793.1 uncharacterized protein LOC122562193 [Chiloscyllium plagiosum]
MQEFMENDSPWLQIFIMSANQFVHKAMDIFISAANRGDLEPRRANAYIKEILHIILFYGQINCPKVDPVDILQGNTDLLLRCFPDVFERCRTHLPTRPPFTVLLDAIVDIVGRRQEQSVLEFLLLQINEMEVPNAGNGLCKNIFVSAVVNFCYFNDEATGLRRENYFGASVTCAGSTQRKIMIDILCYQTWQRDISWAVCIGNRYNRNAFTFPCQVHSMAFNIYTRGESTHGPIARRAPCQKCFIMFPDIEFELRPPEDEHIFWEYGNCAEYESLSQLLNSHPEIASRLHRNRFAIGHEELLTAKYERLEYNLQELQFEYGHEFSFYNSQL